MAFDVRVVARAKRRDPVHARAARAGSPSAPRRPDFPRLEAQLRSSGYCARPGPAARARSRPATSDGRRRVWSTDDRARRRAAQGVREPPRGRLPAVRGALPPGRLPPDRRRPARRQGRPRHGRRAPGGVRDADGAELRARAHARRSARTASRGAAGRGATRRSARTARRSPAARCTPRTTRASASRCAPSASTTRRAVVWNNTLGELWRRTTIYLPRALARAAGMTQKRLRELRARRLRQGRRVPAPRPRAPARRRSGSTARCPKYRAHELHPPPRALRRRAARATRIRAAVADVTAPRRPTSSAAAASRWGGELDVRQLDDRRTSAARSPATWPSTRPRAPNRPAACCTASPSTRSTQLPVREHVRALHARRVRARRRARARRPALRRAARTRSATAATA